VSAALVFEDIGHEDGLQPLRALLAAHMDGALAKGNLVVPGAKRKHGFVAFHPGPHQPPVIGIAFQLAAVWTGTTENQFPGCRVLFDRTHQITFCVPWRAMRAVGRRGSLPLCLY